MKKVGIVTLYDDINIGNKLQNFAVQTYFENLGFECKTIRHLEMTDKEMNFQTIKLLLYKTLGFPKKTAKRLRLSHQRKGLFKEFSDKHLKLGEFISIRNIPSDFFKHYDFFVVGSDQVWHNWTHTKAEVDYFFLRFAKKNQRLTVSPSFGKNNVESKFLNDYIDGLNGFSVLTCREEQGARIVKDTTGQYVTVLLDPTMLVTVDEWTRIEKKPNKDVIPQKYILVYALGNQDENIKKFIKNIARENNLEIIDIYNADYNQLYMTTPDEFLYYIHNAALVITDSFHASVFSILYKTNFVIFERNTSCMGNMTSRIDTLLCKFGMLSRKINQVGMEYLFDTDFSGVEKVLIEERKKADDLYKETFKLLDTTNNCM